MDYAQALHLLAKYVPRQQEFSAMAQKGIDYYENRTDIVQHGMQQVEFAKDWHRKNGENPLRTADNRIPTNWHKILVDQKVGYMFTYPPQFDTKDEKSGAEVIDRVKEVLGDGYEKVIKQLATDASNTGRAWLCYWYDHGRPFEYYFISPLQVIPVYDPGSIKPRLKYLIRRYSTEDENGRTITKNEIWTDRDVTYIDQSVGGSEGRGTVAHNYGCIPFIEFKNNEAELPDLVMYQKVIDSIDKVISGLANDMDDVQEILFVLRGYNGENRRTDYVEQPDGTVKEVPREINVLLEAKLRKFFSVDGEGGVDVLRAEIPFEARKAYMDMLINQLYISAMAVNPDPDKTGNQSGVYIEFLYSLLELKAGLMETEFRPALGEFLRAILRYLGLPEDTQIEQIWTRNKPRNDSETAQIIAGTSDQVMSDETKTKVHPLVEDWREERKRVEKEQRKKQEDLLDQYQMQRPRAGEGE